MKNSIIFYEILYRRLFFPISVHLILFQLHPESLVLETLKKSGLEEIPFWLISDNYLSRLKLKQRDIFCFLFLNIFIKDLRLEF